MGTTTAPMVTGKESARDATICGEKTIEEIENDSRCEQKKRSKNDKTGGEWEKKKRCSSQREWNVLKMIIELNFEEDESHCSIMMPVIVWSEPLRYTTLCQQIRSHAKMNLI